MTHLIRKPNSENISECCWCCNGTGYNLQSVSPMKYLKCFRCRGSGGIHFLNETGGYNEKH